MKKQENKIALITGINGQDGSYLAELLLEKGYEVHGTLKRNSVSETQTSRLNHIYDKLKLHYADLTDMSSLIRVIQEVQPEKLHLLTQYHHMGVLKFLVTTYVEIIEILMGCSYQMEFYSITNHQEEARILLQIKYVRKLLKLNLDYLMN